MTPNELPLDTAKTEESLGIQEASLRSLSDEEVTSLPELDDTAPVAIPGDTVIAKVPFGGVAPVNLEQRIAELQRQERTLQQDIAQLQGMKSELQGQVTTTQGAIASLLQEGLKDLEQRKRDLQITVEQLERRQERIRAEMRTTFAGTSQDLAIRVQSFKEYLVGSLQDLALAADQLELTKFKEPEKPPVPIATVAAKSLQPPTPKFAEESFQSQTKKIRSLIDQYRSRPDYYGPPWQLRRTFEPIHAERVSNWFFTQGGRGALRTMGSRLQNILITSAIVSVLQELYGDRQTTLVLADSPERLGEWRRGLQDCLGITRSDFGPDRGAALFEDPFVLSQKADRMVKDGLLPLVVIDETEEQIDLTLLQYPLWLAFAPNPQTPSYSNY
ncbi:MAG: DUF3086 domain-containing protein [Leptolyngbya sp.]|nr:MAG: DUF3086 domain-containing protein [Leptolyngbya sp.]